MINSSISIAANTETHEVHVITTVGETTSTVILSQSETIKLINLLKNAIEA